MSNKKVYLAKSTLASGLDVEYVKSNLLRIPDIEVVEYASGIKPSECACMVIIPPSTFNHDNGDTDFTVGRGIESAYTDFVNNHPFLGDGVFIYKGKKDSKDVESTCPLYVTAAWMEETESENEFILNIDCYFDPSNLLTDVSEHIGADDYKAWKKIPRHYQPEPIYSMPSVEKIKECMTKKTTSNISRPLKPEECFNSKGILLLRRRK